MNDTSGDLFHPGERALQERFGSSALVQAQGARIVRDHLNDQHRDFYPLLSQIYIGAQDADSCLWASLRCGAPGFVTALDPHHLQIAAPALPGDPMGSALHVGQPLGLLGLDLTNRRRNRANGCIASLGDDGFTLAIERAFGNCPKYIQTRTHEVPPAAPAASSSGFIDGTRIDDDACAQLAAADTFFIASHAQEVAGAGVDVSHRGGKQGFVRVDGDRTLTVPDFLGNQLFMTLGNLLLDARAGLLCVDFATGDLLWLTGRAEIVWDGPEVAAFAGAERLLRFHLERLRRAPGALPQRWSFAEYSPFLRSIGVWQTP